VAGIKRSEWEMKNKNRKQYWDDGRYKNLKTETRSD
jgi:hypothetical protein